MSLKSKQLYARVTEGELKKITKKAKNNDYINLSEYLRDKVVNKKIIEYDLKEINDRLAKVGGELNHLVMLCHQGKIETLDLTKYAREIELLCVALNEKFNE